MELPRAVLFAGSFGGGNDFVEAIVKKR
jgi:hypothetical protein